MSVLQLPLLLLALVALVPLASVELSKAVRWTALFGARRPPFALSLRALLAGQLTNALSPLRAGEAVRLGVLAAQGGALVEGTGALAGAKAIDTLSLVAIAGGVVGTAAVAHSRWALAAGGAIAIGGVLLAVCGPGVRAQLAQLPVVQRLHLHRLLDVAGTLRNPLTVVVLLVTTLIVWTSGLLANAVVLTAVGVVPTFDLAARMLVAGYIVGVLPAPPVRIGVFETGVTVALTSAGVALPAAFAASVTLHVCQLAELALLMLASFLWRR